MRLAALLAVVGAVAGTVAAPATRASQLIDRDATHVRLRTDGHGRAIVTYRARGRTRSVLAWGAVDARSPSESLPQIQFRLRYGAAALAGRCGHYDGPRLARLVAACKDADGSYWAVQSWSRIVPQGSPLATGPRELHLSHWRGAPAVLTIAVDWIAGRYHHLTGRLTYRGAPVYGFRTTRTGSVLDRYGRNVYVDTLNSAYGEGWRRENGFLTRRPTGSVCYGFYRHGARPSGMGEAYRATVSGPGVTPDVMWQARAPARGEAPIASRAACPRQ